MLGQNGKIDWTSIKDKLLERAEILFSETIEKEKTLFADSKPDLSALYENQDNSVSDSINKEKNYGEIADLLYPEMKNESKAKTASKINIASKENIDKKTDVKSDVVKKVNYSLKDLGLDEKNFEIKGNTISPKISKKEFEVINNVKFPRETDNKKIEILKKLAKEDRSARYSEDTEEFLKHHARPEQIGVDHVGNPVLSSVFSQKYGKEAVEHLKMSKTDSYMNTAFAKQHKVYNNYEELPEEFKGYFKDKITQQIGADKLSTTKGIFIDANSKSSASLKENLLKNPDFLKKLKTYEPAMQKNYSVNDSLNLRDTNWHNALGNIDILNMHINKNGDVELHAGDMYDFNEGEKNKKVQAGRNRQEKGKIKPYFSLYHVIIRKDEKNEALKLFIQEK